MHKLALRSYEIPVRSGTFLENNEGSGYHLGYNILVLIHISPEVS